MNKLAVITTHPIQYYAPVFKLLQQRRKIGIKVFYTWGEQALYKHDPGFNEAVSWDIPLLEGYDYEWAENTSANPGSDRYKGVVNPGLPAQVLAWRPDAVLVIGWAYSGHLNAIRKLAGKVPLYFRGDSTLLNEPKGIKGIFKHLFLNRVYKPFTHAFYVGINNKAYFKRYGFSEGRLSFAPHAVDNERFYIKREEEAARLRDSLNLKTDDILLLYAGKFEPVKNISLLLKAFITLNKAGVHLLFAGAGIEEAMLTEMAAKSAAAGNVHFTGFKNQSYMPVLYQAADLVCLASYSETWGLVINEAMACEKAVLVSDKVGCAPDLIKQGVNGDIFASGNQHSLLACMERLTRSKALLDEYGKNSGEMIRDWNFTNIAVAIEDKLNEKN